jgi:aminoglycoside 6'-N-acetyltransferase I
MTLQIIAFEQRTQGQRKDAARILREALAHMPSAYNGPGEAEAEVETFGADPDRFGLAAMEGGLLVGWVGAIRSHSHAWELHPLVVDPGRQRRGVGTALVAALEAKARAEGVLTIWLGTDDDFGGTTLFGRNLFPNVLEHAAGLASTAGHAFTFYRQLGYELVGLLPDVNGFGKPDILMAKRMELQGGSPLKIPG